MSNSLVKRLLVTANGATFHISTFDLVSHVYGGSSDPMWTTTIVAPNGDFASSEVHIMYWDGLGTLSFTVGKVGDTINGGAGPVAFVGKVAPEKAYIFLSYDGYNTFVHVVPAKLHGSPPTAVDPNVQISATDEIDCGHELGDAAVYFADKESADPPTLNNPADEVVAIGSEVGTNAGVGKVLQDGNVLLGPGAGGGATALAAGEICIGKDCTASGVANRLSVQCEGAVVEAALASTHTVSIRINGTLYHISIGIDSLPNANYFSANVVIGARVAKGSVGTQPNIHSNVLIGRGVYEYYQTAGGNVAIGDLLCQQKPSSASFDASCTKIGGKIQRLATGSGGFEHTLIGHGIMESSTCTFAEANGLVAIGKSVMHSASGLVSFGNVIIGSKSAQNASFSNSRVTIVGSEVLSRTSASIGGLHNTLIGRTILNGVGAGVVGGTTIVGASTFETNVAPLNVNVTSLGASQTGIPAASELMLGRGCVASTITGRLSFGNAMEAVKTTATAGAQVLPVAPTAFMPVSYNGVDYRIPLYSP